MALKLPPAFAEPLIGEAVQGRVGFPALCLGVGQEGSRRVLGVARGGGLHRGFLFGVAVAQAEVIAQQAGERVAQARVVDCDATVAWPRQRAHGGGGAGSEHAGGIGVEIERGQLRRRDSEAKRVHYAGQKLVAPLAPLGDEDFDRIAVEIDPRRVGESFLDDVEVQGVPDVPLDEKAALFGKAAACEGVDEGAEPGGVERGDLREDRGRRRAQSSLLCGRAEDQSRPRLRRRSRLAAPATGEAVG